MKKTFLFITILLLSNSLIFAQEIYWKQGYKFVDKESGYKMKFGGRIMNDWFFESHDAATDSVLGDAVKGTEFRRLRMFNSGTIYENISYKIQFDFTGGKVKAKDLYIRFNKLPVVGNITIGQFKIPYSFNEITSSKYVTFMERSFLTEYKQSRATGVMVDRSLLNGKLHFYMDMFVNSDKTGYIDNVKSVNWAYKILGTPFATDDFILHTGASYVYMRPQGGQYEFEMSPEAHAVNPYLNWNINEVSNIQIAQAEIAIIYKNIFLTSEFAQNMINSNISKAASTAFYVETGIFLTGEHKVYDEGEYGRIRPKKNFGDGGLGAFELAARYSRADVVSDLNTKADISDITLGLNWYLNPSVRIMFNFIKSNSYIANGTIGMIRFQVDF